MQVNTGWSIIGAFLAGAMFTVVMGQGINPNQGPWQISVDDGRAMVINQRTGELYTVGVDRSFTLQAYENGVPKSPATAQTNRSGAQPQTGSQPRTLRNSR